MTRLLKASLALLAADLVSSDNMLYNTVQLDNYTHNLLVGKRLPTIIRFDRNRWLGDDELLEADEDPMLSLAKEATGTNILWAVADVRVCTPDEIRRDGEKSSAYFHDGSQLKLECDKEFQDVAIKYGLLKPDKLIKKFHFNTPKFPKYVFVPAADDEKHKTHVVYPGSMKDSKDQFKLWVEKLGFKIRNAGSTEEFDKLSEAFVKAADTEEKEKIIADCEEMAGQIKSSNFEGRKIAEYYVKIMKKTAETMTGDEDGVQFRYWYQTEYDRMKGVLEKGGDKLTDEKRNDMQWKLRKLKLFEDFTPKEEE